MTPLFRASATAFLIPVVALLLGETIRGERVALPSIIGCAVCLAGAWLMRVAQSASSASSSSEVTMRQAA